MPLSKLVQWVIILACFMIVGAAVAAFGTKPMPEPPPRAPREICYGGVVYLQFQGGSVFAKVARGGQPAACQ